MTEITFGPAQGGARKIIGAVAGSTGSGKSMSALELGTGLVADPSRQLFMVDTEFGRGAHYADTYEFQYGQLADPFTPQRYQAAIEAAINAGAECVIVDSLSHIWEGAGGLLDWHNEIALRMAKGDARLAEKYNFTAWNKPKEELNKFVLFMQRCPVHLILCLRAKERRKMVKTVGKDGRPETEIVEAGLQPIIDTATPYEATFLAMLSPEEPGVPHWTHKALASYLQHIFEGDPKQLSREHGKRLAEWCAGGASAAGVAQQEEQPPCERTVAGSTPAASTILTKKRANEIMAAMRGAPNVDAIDELWSRKAPEIMTASVEGQRAIKKVYDDVRATLAADPVAVPPPSFQDEIDALEPEEWRKEEGRVEDERQTELLPE